MRLRKQDDSMQEEEILLIAQVSDALALPVYNAGKQGYGPGL